MNVAAITSSSPSPLMLALQNVLQEAMETVAQTRAEAATGDPQAFRKLELLGDQQAAAAPVHSMIAQPDPGSPGRLLNARA